MTTINTKSIQRTRTALDLNRRVFLAGCFAASGGIVAAGQKPLIQFFSICRAVPLGQREVLVMGRCLGDPIAVGDTLLSGLGGRGECLELRVRDGQASQLATGEHGILRLRGLAIEHVRTGSVSNSRFEAIEDVVLRKARVKLLQNQTKLLPGACQVLLAASRFPAKVVAVHKQMNGDAVFNVALNLPSMISAQLTGSVALVMRDQIIASGRLVQR
ncbi:hypothetical protein [Cognatiyoonia sp. IB215182]|uniref:hypothetical protein n=1 Tax=Cognatiyoonia sp. IB215182 TaxID=3097353 RepID=UPI002A0C6871|nr:hypothetical protein [Cognatiyoonia sp. IB215182]MDX8353240.1 hypothetical protein [Cognatiyoonia sp. IB215182]